MCDSAHKGVPYASTLEIWDINLQTSRIYVAISPIHYAILIITFFLPELK